MPKKPKERDVISERIEFWEESIKYHQGQADEAQANLNEFKKIKEKVDNG